MAEGRGSNPPLAQILINNRIMIIPTYYTAYISGKVTGLPDLNKPKFAAATDLLRSLGYGVVVNPHAVCSTLPKDSDWREFMKRCLKHLPGADVIFLLDDWHKSKGAVIEVLMALLLGIEIKAIETMQVVPKRKLWLLIIKFHLLNPLCYVNKN